MDIVLSSGKWECAVVYFYDLIIFSCKQCQRINDTLIVLGVLKEAVVILKLNKVLLLTDKINCLDLAFHPGYSEIESGKSEDLSCVRIMETQTDLGSHIGLCNVF